MKDGLYALRFSADGFDGEGRLALRDNRGESEEGPFRIAGHLVERGNALTAVFSVQIAPTEFRNSRLPDHYAVNLSGTATENEFTLIGVGPLGVIVDVGGSWIAPLDGRTK